MIKRTILAATILAVLAPSLVSADLATPVSCSQGRAFVVATGSGTLGGASCEVSVSCTAVPCAIRITMDVSGAGRVGGRVYVGNSQLSGCGPSALGCGLTLVTNIGASPTSVFCDTGASPSVAVAVSITCTARQI